MRRKKEKGSK